MSAKKNLNSSNDAKNHINGKNDLSLIKSKKELREDRKKRQMIDAAESLFREKGFEKTTMDDIADRALFSKTTLYNYFNRKEDIILMIAIRAYSKLSQMFYEAVDESLPGIKQVVAMGTQYYEFAQKYPMFRKAFDFSGIEKIYDLTELKKNKPDKLVNSLTIISTLRVEQQNFAILWSEICARGQVDNTISKKYPPQAIAFTLGTLTTGLVDEIMQRSATLDSIGLTGEQIFQMAMDFLENGLKRA